MIKCRVINTNHAVLFLRQLWLSHFFIFLLFYAVSALFVSLHPLPPIPPACVPEHHCLFVFITNFLFFCCWHSRAVKRLCSLLLMIRATSVIHVSWEKSREATATCQTEKPEGRLLPSRLRWKNTLQWRFFVVIFCQLHCNLLHTGVFIWVSFFFSFSRPLWSPKLSQTLPLAAFLDLITKCSFYTRLSHQSTVTGFTVPSCSCLVRPDVTSSAYVVVLFGSSLCCESAAAKEEPHEVAFFAPSFCVHSVPLSWI